MSVIKKIINSPLVPKLPGAYKYYLTFTMINFFNYFFIKKTFHHLKKKF